MVWKRKWTWPLITILGGTGSPLLHDRMGRWGPVTFLLVQYFSISCSFLRKKIKSWIRNWCCAWWDSCFKIVIQSESRLDCVNLIDNCTKEMIDSTEMLLYLEQLPNFGNWSECYRRGAWHTGDLFVKLTKLAIMARMCIIQIRALLQTGRWWM